MHGIIRIGDFWAAETAVIVGDVEIGVDSSIWHHSAIRGDVAPIRLGRRVNVQDGSVLHCKSGVPLEIADDVVIGHRAVVHCRRVGARALIGIGAIVLDDAQIGEDCLVAAGAVVPPGLIVPAGTVVAGVPAKAVRPIRDAERAHILRIAAGYVELARKHAEGAFPAVGGAR